MPNWRRNCAPVLEPLAAYYFLKARTPKGRLIDSVARFHLGNGARLERIDWLGDLSPKGLRESAGIMVNYLYRLEDIEKNHEAYANQGEIAASSAVKKTAEERRPAAIGYAAVVARPGSFAVIASEATKQSPVTWPGFVILEM